MIQDRLHGLGTDDILSALGLQRRRTAVDVIIPTTGIFIAGVMVGAGVALLMAPKSGQETRRELRGRATDLQHRFSRSIRDERSDESQSSRLPDNGGKAREAAQTPK